MWTVIWIILGYGTGSALESSKAFFPSCFITVVIFPAIWTVIWIILAYALEARPHRFGRYLFGVYTIYISCPVGCDLDNFRLWEWKITRVIQSLFCRHVYITVVIFPALWAAIWIILAMALEAH